MKPSPSRSVSALKLSARERRAVALAVVVSVFALAIAWGAVPFARRWLAREDVVAAELDRLAGLRGLVAAEERLRERVRERSAGLEARPQRLLPGRTAALAASALQSLLQDFADRSHLTVSRLDVAGAPDTAGGPQPMIPATLSAVGDIYGLTDMLSLIQHGPLLLEITELGVRPNPALRG